MPIVQNHIKIAAQSTVGSLIPGLESPGYDYILTTFEAENPFV